MSSISARLSMNVRLLREAVGLSQAALARRAGISQAALSRLEAGARTRQWRRSGRWPRPFTDLTGELDLPPITLIGPDDGEWLPGEVIASRMLHRDDAPGVVELYDVRLSSTGTRRSEPHQRGLTEQLIVQSGRVRVGPVDAPVVARVGDAVVFSGDVQHAYEALDDRDATALLLVHYPVRLTASASVNAGATSASRRLADEGAVRG